MTIWSVSLTGSASNAGTLTSPWDRATGLTSPLIKPGDSVQFRAGRYGTGTETFTITLNGGPTQPVTITNAPGELVAWDVFTIDYQGSHTIIQPQSASCGLEIYRSTLTPSDNTDLIRMSDGGDGNKLIHVATHDGAGDGVAPQSETADHEVYGCYVYNNGRIHDAGGTYAHGIYPHGTTTAGQQRKIRNNILFSQAAYGLHCFADTGNLQNLDVENNIAFMNSVVQGQGIDILLGGQTAMANLQALNNVGLRTDGNTVASIGLLEDSDPGASNVSGTVKNNYMAGGVTVNNWDGATLTFQNNTMVAADGQALKLEFQGAAAFTGFTWNSNAYASVGSAFGSFALDINSGTTETTYDTFAEWKAATGLDATGSTFTAANDLGTKIFLFPSVYDTARGHLAIHNPASAAAVAVDISSVVPVGHTFAIYHVYDLPTFTNSGATPVASGTYAGGTVSVPMSGKTPPAIIGGVLTATNALPQIGVFVVFDTQLAPVAPPPDDTPPPTDSPPPTQPPPTTSPTPSTGVTPVPSIFDRTPVTTTAGDGANADLDYRLMLAIQKAVDSVLGTPSVPVASVSVSPPSATLQISTPPTQAVVASVTVSPGAATLNPPTQIVNTGTLRHMSFGHTYFGKTPNTADMTWAEDAPPHRYTAVINGPTSTIRSLYPEALTFTYSLHHATEATGQETSDNVTSSWGTLATTWAQSNGRNLENLFLHAAVGQQNNIATVATVDATGKITLGINTANNRQQLTQARAGVAASNAFQPGTQYTLTGVTGITDGTVVTVQSIVSQTVLQTDYTGPAGTGGKIYKPGDGTMTLANRVFYEDLTDWWWSANPGSQDGRDFQVFRIGQIISPTVTGPFFDVHTAAAMHTASIEYGQTSKSQFVTDITSLLSLYRTTYPGSLIMPNIGPRTTSAEEGFALAAGACQQEGGFDLFGTLDFGTTGTIPLAQRLLAQGVVIDFVTFPQFNATEPQAGASGLSTAFRSGGGHNYGTPDARAIMTTYAAALMLVDQRTSAQIAAGTPKLLNYDPANQFWDTFPLSARWFTAFEVNVGEPTAAFPSFTKLITGTDGAGQAATVYARTFSASGSEADTTTAIVLLRTDDHLATKYDVTSAFTVLIPGSASPGQTFGILKEDGTKSGTFVPGDSVGLYLADSVILISNT